MKTNLWLSLLLVIVAQLATIGGVWTSSGVDAETAAPSGRAIAGAFPLSEAGFARRVDGE